MNLLRKVSILLIGFLVALIFSEILLRIFWNPPYLNPKYQRDDHSWLKENVVLNSFGYRDRQFNLEKKPGTYRIYSLGDSYTYGWYINNALLSYPKVLEKLLQERYGQTIEVINASKPGFNLVDEVLRFENQGMLFSPDLVIVGINIFDILGKDISTKYIDNDFIKNLRIYQLSLGNLERARVSKLIDRQIKDAYKDSSSEILKADTELQKLKSLTESIGAKFVLVIFPSFDPENSDKAYQYYQYNNQFKKLGVKNSISVLDLQDNFSNYQDKKGLVLNPTDPHPSIIANNLAANFIFNNFDFNKLLDNPPIKLETYTTQINQGYSLPPIKSIISIEPSDWVYFNREFKLDTQTQLLLSDSDKQVKYLEDILKTAKSATHEGWPGAKIEYRLEGGNQLKIPLKLYNYPVVGIGKITGFWEKDGATHSEDLSPFQVLISKDQTYIYIDITSKNIYSLFTVFVDVGVKQIDLEGNMIADISSTRTLTQSIKKGQAEVKFKTLSKIGSLPEYVWVNEKQQQAKFQKKDNSLQVLLEKEAAGDGTIEIPLSEEGLEPNESLPEVKYR